MEESVTMRAVVMARDYLDMMLDEHTDFFSSSFLHKAVDLLDNVRPHPH